MVSPSDDDRSPGTAREPLRTLTAAQAAGVKKVFHDGGSLYSLSANPGAVFSGSAGSLPVDGQATGRRPGDRARKVAGRRRS